MVSLLPKSLLFSSILVSPLAAHAAVPGQAEYTRLVQEAQAAHETGDHSTCAAQFQQAHAISGDANLLFNRGVCLFDGGDDSEAKAVLEAFLATNPESEASLEAHRMLARIRATAQRKEAESVALAERRQDHDRATLGLGVGAGALLIAAGGLTIHAAERWDAAREACPGLKQCPDGRGRALSSDASTSADIATGLWIVGGVAATAALVVWLSTPEDSTKSSLSIGLSPLPSGGGLVIRGSL